MNLQNTCIIWGPILFKSDDDNVGTTPSEAGGVSIKSTSHLTELLQFLVENRKNLNLKEKSEKILPEEMKQLEIIERKFSAGEKDRRIVSAPV